MADQKEYFFYIILEQTILCICVLGFYDAL